MESRGRKTEETCPETYCRLDSLRIAFADPPQQPGKRGHSGGRDHGHVQFRQPLHERAAHRTASDRMEWRGFGCYQVNSPCSCTHRASMYKHHRDHADQACTRALKKGFQGKRAADRTCS